MSPFQLLNLKRIRLVVLSLSQYMYIKTHFLALNPKPIIGVTPKLSIMIHFAILYNFHAILEAQTFDKMEKNDFFQLFHILCLKFTLKKLLEFHQELTSALHPPKV